MINIFNKNSNFIERSIMGALSFLKDSVLSDEYALQKGFLQSINPQIKALTFVLFIIAVMLAEKIPRILFIYIFCIMLTYISGIRIGFFLKRTWVFIPLFSLFIAVPALFSNFSPAEPLFVFGFLGLKLVVTRTGVLGASLFFLRVLTSVSLVVLLSLTTRHTELLKVLRILRVPHVFVLTLGMCYRYIYLFAEIIENTYLAIKSRVGISLHYKKGQGIVASNIANLWQRSIMMNQEVYNAMLSRGYTGEPKLLHRFNTVISDWVWLFFSMAIFAALIYPTSPFNK